MEVSLNRSVGFEKLFFHTTGSSLCLTKKRKRSPNDD